MLEAEIPEAQFNEICRKCNNEQLAPGDTLAGIAVDGFLRAGYTVRVTTKYIREDYGRDYRK